MTDRPGEDDLIARFFAPLAGPAGLGLKDDVALISPPAGRDLVVTTDALVAGVHFFADDPPDAIARKALRVNLSDLAAKGAEPLGFTLDLALPNDWTADWLAAFAAGLGKDAAYYAGLKNYPCPGAPWRPRAVAWVGGENPGVPDLVVDVSSAWDQRMAAFDAFGSQFTADPSQPPTRISNPAFRRGVEGRAMHWGSLILASWAEALWTDKPVPPALLAFLASIG